MLISREISKIGIILLVTIENKLIFQSKLKNYQPTEKESDLEYLE